MFARYLRSPAAVQVVGVAVCMAAALTCGCTPQSFVPLDGGGGSGGNGGNSDGGDPDDQGGSGGASGSCPANPDVVSVTIYANYENGVRIGRGEQFSPIRAELEMAPGASAAGVSVCWESSQPSTFTVTSIGDLTCRIEGVAVGTATLTARVGTIESEPLDIIVQADPVLPGMP